MIEALWERLGIGKTLRDLVQSEGVNPAYERALLAMTANRLCEPESKLGVWGRWLSKVYMPGCHDLKRDHMYEAMDFFHVWTPQVIVALAVTTEGLPVSCWVFDGNTSDVDTIEKVRSDLRGWNLNRALFVADAGMNSRTNKEALARACGKYLLATRMVSVAEVKRDVLSKRGRRLAPEHPLQRSCSTNRHMIGLPSMMPETASNSLAWT